MCLKSEQAEGRVPWLPTGSLWQESSSAFSSWPLTIVRKTKGACSSTQMCFKPLLGSHWLMSV